MITITAVQSLNESAERTALFGSRNLVYFDIDVQGEIYPWQAYVPLEEPVQQFLDSKATEIAADIAAKEALWEESPKTKMVEDEAGNKIEAGISKDEIVRPDVPDHIEKRKSLYPPIGEYLDAVVKQNSGDPQLMAEGDAQLDAYVQKCLTVKTEKPEKELANVKRSG